MSSDALHLPTDAITWYCVAASGTANGFFALESLSPAEGDHVKYRPFVTGKSCKVSVRHIVVSAPAKRSTSDITFTLTESVLMQPLSFTVTTYVVVFFGDTLGSGLLMLLTFIVGDQVNLANVSVLEACNCTVSILQISVS